MDFQKTYNRTDYLNFFRDTLLPEDFEITDETITPDFQTDRIQRVTKIGHVPSLDLPVFEAKHKSENDPRVTLSKESFRILANYGKQQALILFISTAAANFRLSLITLDLKLEGKRVKKEYSNPRRYSFFLGPDCKAHTPQEYLAKKRRIKDLDDLKSRFSIEVVNKEFYTEIALLFTKLTGGTRKIGSRTYDEGKGLLKLPDKKTEIIKKEFAVRLIGRLIFCWFLKKKTSKNGIPLIPEEILSLQAIDNKNVGGYYHSTLEPLFFEVLNTPVSERKKLYKNSHWKLIPFLNGGLFTPHEHDFYELFDTGVSKHISELKVPDDWLIKLLEIFDTYNFTIDENTPVDIELSIEPEMLGRIFENLLAEINPETGETARKATGSYYTPRPIVEYMVDESLKQYLLTKTGLKEEGIADLLSYSDNEDFSLSDNQKEAVIEALHAVRIIDPACGSGAFPMGILQKILLVLQKLDPDSKIWLEKLLSVIPDPMYRKELKKKIKVPNYLHKLGIIRDCIFGVDIQPIAVEISKLRCFLSLIVDEKVDDGDENRGIEHLPNLEFKFVCANTLIGLPGTKKLGNVLIKDIYEDEDNIAKLKELRDLYLISYSNAKKNIEDDFKKVQSAMLNQAITSKNVNVQTLALQQWNPFSDEPCSWFDPDWMFGVKDGFDIVIGNPPYGADLSSTEKNILDRIYHIHRTNVKNSAIYFIYKANDFLSEQGINSFIVPKSLCYSAGWNKCADFMINTLSRLIDMGKAFDNVLLEQLVFVRIKTHKIEEYINGLFENHEVKEYAKVSKSIFFSYHVLLAGQTPTEIEIIKHVLASHQHTYGEYVSIERGLNWQSRVAHNRGKTPIYRGAQLNRYVLSPPTDFANVDMFSEGEYSYQMRPKIMNQLAIAHVMNPYPHFYLQSVLDEKGEFLVYETISCTFLKNNIVNLKFLLGLNNSKLFAWLLYKFVYSNAIRSTRYDEQYVSKIPIPQLNDKLQYPIIMLVDHILAEKRKNPLADTASIELQIDQIVYELYGLTPAEIAIIENSGNY